MKNILNRSQSLEAFNNKNNPKINLARKKVASEIEKILESKINFGNLDGNIDFRRELMLAKIFGLTEEQKTKLSKDYSENLTINDVLKHLEGFINYNSSNKVA